MLKIFAAFTMVCVAIGVPPANAANFVSYVSLAGSDANTCAGPSPASACRSFQHAYDNTTAGGEIDCVDAANYGLIQSLNKSITVDCAQHPGNASSPWLISVGASDTVILRGLNFNYLGGNNSVLDIGGQGVVRLEKITIVNGSTASNGVNFAPSGNAKLFIEDSNISGQGNAVLVKPSGGQTTLTIERTTLENSVIGLNVDASNGTIKGMFLNSFSTGNSTGIETFSSGNNATLTIDNGRIVNNSSVGLTANGSNEGMIVSRSVINNNGRGLFPTAGGVIYSYGDNRVNGNVTTDGSFTATIPVR